MISEVSEELDTTCRRYFREINLSVVVALFYLLNYFFEDRSRGVFRPLFGRVGRGTRYGCGPFGVSTRLHAQGGAPQGGLRASAPRRLSRIPSRTWTFPRTYNVAKGMGEL